MFRIDGVTAAAALPAPKAAGVPGYFTDGDPARGIQPTTMDNDWANTLQEELMAILAAAGIAPDKNNHAQVLQALQQLFGMRSDSAFMSWASSTPGAGDLTVNTSGYAVSGAWQEYTYNLVLPSAARLDIMTSHKQAFSNGNASWACRLNIGGTILDDAWGSAIEDKVSLLGSEELPAGNYTVALEVQADASVSIIRPRMRLAWKYG